MGKKIKKVVKKGTKGLMGGATKLASKAFGSLTGAEAMSSSMKAQEASQRAAAASALQAQRDAVANLSTENVADIRTGDAAVAVGTESALRRKKRPGALSAQLGINL